MDKEALRELARAKLVQRPDSRLFPEGTAARCNRLLADPELFEAAVMSCPYQRRRTPAVYARAVLRAAGGWRDAHWGLDRAELLRRVREWNAEVEADADERGLEGEARAVFVAREGASELAPCGNPDCLATEARVKGHRLCGGCGAVRRAFPWPRRVGVTGRLRETRPLDMDRLLSEGTAARCNSLFTDSENEM